MQNVSFDNLFKTKKNKKKRNMKSAYLQTRGFNHNTIIVLSSIVMELSSIVTDMDVSIEWLIDKYYNKVVNRYRL